MKGVANIVCLLWWYEKSGLAVVSRPRYVLESLGLSLWGKKAGNLLILGWRMSFGRREWFSQYFIYF